MKSIQKRPVGRKRIKCSSPLYIHVRRVQPLWLTSTRCPSFFRQPTGGNIGSVPEKARTSGRGQLERLYTSYIQSYIQWGGTLYAFSSPHCVLLNGFQGEEIKGYVGEVLDPQRIWDCKGYIYVYKVVKSTAPYNANSLWAVVNACLHDTLVYSLKENTCPQPIDNNQP